MTGEIILNDLAHLPVWVGWREEQRKGKQTKVPYAPRTRKEASSTDPTTWSTRGEAETWAATHRGGVGIVLSQLNGNDCCLCGIDLDTCRDPTTDFFQDWAQEVIDRFATYTEVSPSGTGAKIFFTHASHDLPAIERLFGGKGGRQFKNGGGEHCPAIEIFRAGRYFTVTDESIGSTDILRQVPLADLEWIIREAGPRFAHKESQKSESSGNDKSRSGKAFRKGAALKAAGHSYDAMRDALLADEDPEIAEWARTKGLDNGERELHRIYDKAGKANGEAPPISPIKIYTYDEMLAMPEACFVVEGVIVYRGKNLIFGVSNVFKSFHAVDLGGSVSTGRSYHGKAVKKMKTFYCANEGAIGVGRKRIAAWMAYHQIPQAERRNIFLITAETIIPDEASRSSLLAAIRELVEPGEDFFIIFDIHRGTMNAPDKDDEAADAWIKGAEILIKEGATILSIAHSPYSDATRARGSSHGWGSWDGRLLCEGDQEKLTSVLKVDRFKDHESCGQFGFTLDKQEVEEHPGEFSLVPRFDDAAKETKKHRKLSDSATNVLDALTYALSEVGATSPASNHIPYNVKCVTLKQWRDYFAMRTNRTVSDKADSRERAFSRACEKLTREKIIGIWGTYAWLA